MHKSRSAAYRMSATVFLALAILTGIEYFVSQVNSSAAILLLLGLIKAYAVVYYFMHINRLWTQDGGH